MSQFPAVIDLADIDGHNGLRLDGVKAGAGLGESVAVAGDVDGDGMTDIIIGGYGDQSAYVIFNRGGALGTSSLSNLDGSNGFKIDDFHIGQTVASAGDVNGDGFDDVLVGSWREGAAYLIYGKDEPFDPLLHLTDLDGTSGSRFDYSGFFAGMSVDTAGDVNGDGFDDFIIGTRGHYSVGHYSGASYVIFGRAGGFEAHVKLNELTPDQGFHISDAERYDANGRHVSGAGDVNGDGFDDVIVTASGYAQSSYVIFGHAGNFGAGFSLANIDGSNGFQIDQADFSVAQAGDVNGDGIDDLVVSDGVATSAVIFGASHFDAEISMAGLDGTDGFRMTGFGGWTVVAAAGDVNGDGFDDVVVGARFADGQGQDSGVAYVVFGKAAGFDPAIDLTTLDGTDGFRIRAIAAGDQVGASVSSAGDQNGDGLDDLLIGAPGSDAAGAGAGSVYVLYSLLPQLSVNRTGTSASQHLVGGVGNDRLNGLGGDDELWGNAGKDRMLGSSGADTLHGGESKDVLSGGAGDDVLIGGLGRDHMGGGAGADTFRFAATFESPGKGFDFITDLEKGDIIDLSAIDADLTQDGDQAFHRVDAFTHQAGELVLVFDEAKGFTLLEGDVDGDGKSDLTVELTGRHDHFAGLVL